MSAAPFILGIRRLCGRIGSGAAKAAFCELGDDALEPGAGVFEAGRELEKEASHGGAEKIGDEANILNEFGRAREPAGMGDELVGLDAVDETPAADLLAPLPNGGDRRP
jgi:hypothetical protein